MIRNAQNIQELVEFYLFHDSMIKIIFYIDLHCLKAENNAMYHLRN